MRREMLNCTTGAFAGVGRVFASEPLAHGAVLFRTHGDGDRDAAMKPSRFSHWCADAIAIALLAFVTSAVGADAAPYQTRAGADDVQRVVIVGGSYFFRPDHIVVQAGRSLEITVRVEPGVIPHRFVLESTDGKVLADVPLGKKAKTLRFALPAGDYLFHCPNRLLLFKSHRERGMAGVLEVQE
ncbi:cupredoxin domain-containing protein [Pseudomonas sp. 2FE]|uniref:cupredoxin domain-containing protein n=1 Tax=Pseudomonas sp. 2FE TaxID=2502190 RepID=UPI001C499CC3|nr:cupredoxin domain-containing protein [Pseudomonas sp. 2FE]